MSTEAGCCASSVDSAASSASYAYPGRCWNAADGGNWTISPVNTTSCTGEDKIRTSSTEISASHGCAGASRVGGSGSKRRAELACAFSAASWLFVFAWAYCYPHAYSDSPGSYSLCLSWPLYIWYHFYSSVVA